MNREEFKIFWEFAYANTVPIPHYLKHDYSNRWFRIHSLPESKRYADDQEDWKILLKRQNTIFSDLIGDQSPILMVTGEYDYESHTELVPFEERESVTHFSFVYLDPIDLHLLNSEEFEKGQIYRPKFSEEIWHEIKFEPILKDIALDQLRAFFISVKNNCIVAPYDGGMDVIVKDTVTRDSCKIKYRSWLSKRDDGL
ncbi:DUF3885 domain-containing protein [Flavitalea flava]